MLGVRPIALLALVAHCGSRSALDTPDTVADATPDVLDAALTRDASPDVLDASSPCGGSATLQVPITVPWSDTGLDVPLDARLTVHASGIVQYGPMSSQTTDANGGNFDGTRFFPASVLPNAITVSLIGKIGGTTDVGTGIPVPEGVPGDGAGFVGTTYDEIIPESGRLFLGFNDQIGYFGDNSGAFTVMITITCNN
jgi:hypothetical protein